MPAFAGMTRRRVVLCRGARPPHPGPLRAPRRRETPVEEGSIQITVDRSGSWRANVLGDWGVRSLATKAALGGRAIQRAVMWVNLEQASKVELRMPTGGRDREGSMVREAIDASTCPIRRGSEDGTLERCFGQRGRSRSVAERRQRPLGGRPVGKSGRIIVPGKPGNAGGGMDPDFWRALPAGEEG